jgi:hypothetical protein
MFVAILIILLLCCMGISASSVGIKKINDLTDTSEIGLICCIMSMILVAFGGMYFVATSPF